MRKWYLLIILMLIAAVVACLGGCDGNEGPPGDKGDKGPNGLGGTDPFTAAPSPSYVSIGITNATLDGPAGIKHVLVAFDSTMTGNSDTVVANYVSQPPLIDGTDGEEPEYGDQSSKLRLSFFNPTADPAIQDPNIYEVLCRAAYDEEYIYMMLQWKEISISVKDSTGADVFLVLASISNELNELRYSRKPDTAFNAVTEKWDTTFNYFRIDTGDVVIDTVYCPPPYDFLICEIDTDAAIDTSYYWKSTGIGEDRLAVIWNQSDQTPWDDDAFDLLFRKDGYQPALPSALMLDVWLWGASSSDPVGSADDWWIDGSGLVADAGSAPYLNNFSEPDSLPLYMNRLDPNLRTLTTPGTVIYPLWYFDAVGFRQAGWRTTTTVFLPGIVTVTPTLSRADVYAASTFDNGVWTVEMRRARDTHNGDDLSF